MRVGTLIVVAVGCLAPQMAHAFGVRFTGGFPTRWENPTVRFEINAAGTSDVSGGNDLDLIRESAQVWSSIACSNLVLQELPTTNQTSTLAIEGVTDGNNRIVWIEDARWDLGSQVLGVTVPIFQGAGEILEADIAFNGRDFAWSEDGSGGVDIRSVAIHELGHFIGLQHVLGGESLPEPPTMSPNIDTQLRTRTLSNDDASGACFLYPARAYECNEDCDCATAVDIDSSGFEFNFGRQTCVAGTCGGLVVGGSNLPLGSACADSNDCNPLLFCQPTNGFGSYCSRSCTTGADCPSSFDCVPFVDAPGGACLPSDIMSAPAACQADVAQGFEENGRCSCDRTTACDDDCDCDPECSVGLGCVCDRTFSCDPNCPCDPECGGGCGQSPTGAEGGTVWGFLGILGCLLITRRRR